MKKVQTSQINSGKSLNKLIANTTKNSNNSKPQGDGRGDFQGCHII